MPNTHASRLVIFALIATLLIPIASAQDPFDGRDEYPQFRNLSGLPGGLFGVLPSGKPGIGGALALSTPIAYSLANGRLALVGADMSFTDRPQFIDPHGEDANPSSNGTLAGMVGIGVPFGNFTVADMALSSKLDQVFNIHFTPKLNNRGVGIGLGVQDIKGHGGGGGAVIDQQEGTHSQSRYAVITHPCGRSGYLSVGWGDGRFRRPFGSASQGISKWGRALVEFDGFNWNCGLAAKLGAFEGAPDRPVEINGFIGLIRGGHTTLGLSATF